MLYSELSTFQRVSEHAHYDAKVNPKNHVPMVESTNNIEW